MYTRKSHKAMSVMTLITATRVNPLSHLAISAIACQVNRTPKWGDNYQYMGSQGFRDTSQVS